MLADYHSDALQIQVEGHFQQMRSRNIIVEEYITYVQKGLAAVVNKIEELTKKFHGYFQTELNKIYYLSDYVAEFSEWSLGPIENIHSQKI